jgi:hypothetical protein
MRPDYCFGGWKNRRGRDSRTVNVQFRRTILSDVSFGVEIFKNQFCRYADQKMTDLKFVDQVPQIETLKAEIPTKHQLVGKRSIGAADGKQIFMVSHCVKI